MGHLQVEPVQEGVRMQQPVLVPFQESVRMQVGGAQSVDVARLRLHNVADAPQRARQHDKHVAAILAVLARQFENQPEQSAEPHQKCIRLAAEERLQHQPQQVPQQAAGQAEEVVQVEGRLRADECMRRAERSSSFSGGEGLHLLMVNDKT